MSPQFTKARRLASEAIGTAFLLAAIVGSGIMGENLSGGSMALALLANTLATAAALVVLITMFGPISGAHFNPVVTLVLALRGELTARLAILYSVAQTGGAIMGVLVAHAHVWRTSLSAFRQAERWQRTGTLRIRRDIRSCCHHPGHNEVQAGLHRYRRRPLHRRRLLVYRFHILRQSRSNHCPQHVFNLFGNCSRIGIDLHRLTTDRCDCRFRGFQMAPERSGGINPANQ